MLDLLEEAKRLSEAAEAWWRWRSDGHTSLGRRTLREAIDLGDLLARQNAELVERVEQLTGAVIEYETRLGIPPFASIVDREALAAQQRERERG